MKLIDKLRVLSYLLPKIETIDNKNNRSLRVMEQILFGETNIIDLGCSEEDSEFKMGINVKKTPENEILTVSAVKMKNDEPIDNATQEICRGYNNQTLGVIIHWILSEGDIGKYSSLEDLMASIKNSYNKYLMGDDKNIFKDREGNDNPEDVIIANINYKIAKDMLDCYNHLNPNRDVVDRQTKDTFMDEITFNGLYDLLNLSKGVDVFPKSPAEDCLLGGIASLPGFELLQNDFNLHLRPTNQDFEKAVGLARINDGRKNGDLMVAPPAIETPSN